MILTEDMRKRSMPYYKSAIRCVFMRHDASYSLILLYESLYFSLIFLYTAIDFSL